TATRETYTPSLHDALPISKSTIADLLFLRANGWDRDLHAHRARGGVIVGLCGGYQMLGRRIEDPLAIEGPQREAEGLGFLDVERSEEHTSELQSRENLVCR